jgi:hypothetical protein
MIQKAIYVCHVQHHVNIVILHQYLNVYLVETGLYCMVLFVGMLALPDIIKMGLLVYYAQ